MQGITVCILYSMHLLGSRSNTKHQMKWWYQGTLIHQAHSYRVLVCSLKYTMKVVRMDFV